MLLIFKDVSESSQEFNDSETIVDIYERCAYVDDVLLYDLFYNSQELLSFGMETRICETEFRDHDVISKVSRLSVEDLMVHEKNKREIEEVSPRAGITDPVLAFNLVRKNGLILMYVRYQTERLCIEAVRNCLDARIYVQDLTENIIIEIVKHKPELIQEYNCTHRIHVEALKKSGLAIRYIEKQTNGLCKLAVAQNPCAIGFIRCKTRELCESAFSSRHEAIRYIDNQNEDFYRSVLRIDPFLIRHLPENIFNESLCLFAIKINPFVLRYISAQTEEMCLRAVRHRPETFSFVKIQTRKICLAAMNASPLTLIGFWPKRGPMSNFEKIRHPDSQINTRHNLNLVENQTEEICLASVKRNGMTVCFAHDQTNRVQFEAVKENLSAFTKIHCPSDDVKFVMSHAYIFNGKRLETQLETFRRESQILTLDIVRSGRHFINPKKLTRQEYFPAKDAITAHKLIFRAARKLDVYLFESLLKIGVPIDVRNRRGNAIYKYLNRDTIVHNHMKKLLEEAPKTQRCNPSRDCPRKKKREFFNKLFGILYSNYEHVELLEKHIKGCKSTWLNTNINGITPLMCAVMQEKLAYIQCLIKYHAKIHIRSGNGMTVMEWANVYGSLRVQRFFFGFCGDSEFDFMMD